jgi:outer membrane receptor for ferrienterochelin and colicin
MSYRIDDTSRLSLLLNASNSDFQIPDTAGVPPAFPLVGHPNALNASSTSIDENQNEQQYYSVLAYQKSIDKLSFQAAFFTRYGVVHFTPDFTNDLIFQGVAGEVRNSFFTNGVQFDGSYVLNDQHTIHAGFARYFVPPPLQQVGSGTVIKFANTTNAPENFVSDPLKVERSNYYDLGISRQITKPWTVSVDGFYKDAHNLVDNGQFGNAVIITPFNYRLGQVFGAELSSTYTQGPISAFGNFSYVNTLGKDIISNQYLFSNAELAFIHSHYIKLDHEGEYTASFGVSYTLKNDMVYADVLYGSGLRKGFVNSQKEQEYLPVNLGYQHMFRIDRKNVVKFRVDVLNVFDESYQLRDGSGVGVASAQFGQRRTFLAGISYEF